MLLVLRTHSNTDGNKLVIFSDIASYYGDTYILLVVILAEVDTMPQQPHVHCTSTTKLGWTPYRSDSTLSVANHRSGV